MANIQIEDQTFEVDDSFLKLSPEDQDKVVEDIIKQSVSQKMPGWQSFLRGMMDMGTFGYDDELIAWLRSEFRGENYKDALEYQREDKKRSQSDHPWWYGGGNVVGAVPSMIMPGLRAGGSLAAAAGAGAAGGYLYGSGSADVPSDAPLPEQLKERFLVQPWDDALVGAAGGAAGHVIGKVATKAIKGGANTIQRMLPGSAPILNERLAAGQVADAITNASGGAPDAIDDAIAKVGSGQPIVSQSDALADAGGSAYRLSSPGARQRALEGLDTVLQGQKQTVASGLKGAADGADNGYAWLEGHIDDITSKASKEYDKVFSATPAVNKSVQDVVNSVTAGGEPGQKVIAVARSMMPDFPDFASGAASRPLTLQEAEVVRRALTTLGKSNDSNGAYYRAMEKMLRSALDNNYSSLKGVRATWASREPIEDAFEAGRKVMSTDADMTAKLVGDMSQGEKQAWAKGVWTELRRRLGTRTPEQIGSLKTWAKTEDGQKVLRLLGSGNADTLIEDIARFESTSKARQAMIGGSPTALRLATDSRPKGGIGRTVLEALDAWGGGSMMAATGVLKRGLMRFFAEAPESMKRFPPEVQDRILDIMVSTDGPRVAEALRAYQSGNAVARQKAQKILMNAMLKATQSGFLSFQQNVEGAMSE